MLTSPLFFLPFSFLRRLPLGSCPTASHGARGQDDWGHSCAEGDSGFLPLSGPLSSESLHLEGDVGQGLLRPKAGGRPLLLRREDRMRVSFLDVEMPGSALGARFEFLGNTWLHLKRPQMVSALKAMYLGPILFPCVCSWVPTKLFFIPFYTF